jgi:hypothetical protein
MACRSVRPLLLQRGMNKLVSLALLVAASTPVLADPASTPPSASPAPQNEAWSNVSHINGVPVKVGERGDYLLSYKRFNVSTNPVGWICGFYGVSASYALNEHIAVRADGNYLNNPLGGTWSGYEVGISAPIYLKRVYSGPFIEPGFIARGQSEQVGGYDSTTNTATMSTTTARFVGPEMLLGYHLTFDSGFNMAVAAGIARNLDTAVDASSDQYEFAGYFRVGYAF